MKTGKTGGLTGFVTMMFRDTTAIKILAVMCLLISGVFLPQMAQADTKANLHGYCKSVMHSNHVSVVYKHKQRAWKCTKYVTAMGFNTTYNKPVKYIWINPRSVCSRQFRADWSKVNAHGVYCRSLTQVRFCNRHYKKVWLALGYYANRGDGWRTEGWWVVNPRSCMTHTLPSGYRGDLYIYGADDRGDYWTGSTSFCLKRDGRFRINHSDISRCGGNGYERKRFIKYRVQPGLSRFNIN